jgi:copper transport protein
MNAMRTLLLLLLLGLGASWSAPARAHASLIESHPADGAVLSEAPARLMLEFNEAVAPLVLRLVSADGTAIALERYRIAGTTIEIDAPDIGAGSHVLSWRVASEDGHPIGGSVLFSVGAPSTGLTTGAPARVDRLVFASIWLAKVAIYLGLVIGIGGFCFDAFMAPLPRGARQAGILTLLVGLAAVPLSVGVQGLDALAAPVGDLVEPDVWRAGFGSSYGTTAIIAACAMTVALLGFFSRRAVVTRILAIAALVGGGGALAASGHASAAAPQLLMRPAVFLHVIGVTLWIGALLPLGLILRQGRKDAAAALRRFSRFIPYVLVPLVASGVVLALVQVADPAALWSTAYGRVLLAKLAHQLGLFALAAINRWRLTGAVQAGEPAARRRLVRSIVVEIILAAIILGVVATWRFTPPPRALDDVAARPVAVHLHAGQAMAYLTITPARIGPVTVSIDLMANDLTPLQAKEVTLVLANPDAGIEPIRRAATDTGDGAWQIDGLIVPIAGRWSVRLDVLISDFEQVRLESTFEIAR